MSSAWAGAQCPGTVYSDADLPQPGSTERVPPFSGAAMQPLLKLRSEILGLLEAARQDK